MKVASFYRALPLLLYTSVLAATVSADRHLKKGSRSSSKSSKPSSSRDGQDVTLRVTNLSHQQPMAPFFVMAHNKDAEPLFVFGEAASSELAFLAENGGPNMLVEKFQAAPGVDADSVAAHVPEPFPFDGGDITEFTVSISKEYPLVTIAAMAINTNDCFVALNGEKVYAGQTFYLDGLDAGSEENNENCDSMPGPACPSDSGNNADGNGEGYVHVHRGFFGIGDDNELTASGYDWRNPMAKVEIM